MFWCVSNALPYPCSAVGTQCKQLYDAVGDIIVTRQYELMKFVAKHFNSWGFFFPSFLSIRCRWARHFHSNLFLTIIKSYVCLFFICFVVIANHLQLVSLTWIVLLDTN